MRRGYVNPLNMRMLDWYYARWHGHRIGSANPFRQFSEFIASTNGQENYAWIGRQWFLLLHQGPAAMILIGGFLGLVLVLLLLNIASSGRRAVRRARRVPCKTCGTALLPQALVCPNCGNRTYRGWAGRRERLWQTTTPVASGQRTTVPSANAGNQVWVRIWWGGLLGIVALTALLIMWITR